MANDIGELAIAGAAVVGIALLIKQINPAKTVGDAVSAVGATVNNALGAVGSAVSGTCLNSDGYGNGIGPGCSAYNPAPKTWANNAIPPVGVGQISSNGHPDIEQIVVCGGGLYFQAEPSGFLYPWSGDRTAGFITSDQTPFLPGTGAGPC